MQAPCVVPGGELGLRAFWIPVLAEGLFVKVAWFCYLSKKVLVAADRGRIGVVRTRNSADQRPGSVTHPRRTPEEERVGGKLWLETREASNGPVLPWRRTEVHLL